MVFQLASCRHERSSMIISLSKGYAECGHVLGDEVLTTAILDRFLPPLRPITPNGPSYRLKTASPSSPQEVNSSHDQSRRKLHVRSYATDT
jgi:DNA replication protein DnaC